jgi:hypothetical protein
MKYIFASLVSLFLAATFSDSASCFHVSAAEIHTPISATIVNGITVRVEARDSTIDSIASVHIQNTTSPADI